MMNRRNWLRLAASPWLSPLPAAARRPNIIVILADDLGYADLGSFGCKDIPTPHIDSLAKRGVRFTNSYVSAPYCSPTRAGLLTGRYQQRFGHEFNAHPTKRFLEAGGDPENQGLPLTETTVADRLKQAGYSTGVVGKWHLGDRTKFHPLNRGFQEFFGFLGGARSYFPGDQTGAGRPEVLRNFDPVKWDGYLTDLLAREAAAYIERHQKNPFFLYLAFNAVHTPMEASENYSRRFPSISDPRRRTYAAMLAAMDEAVGTVLAKLRSTNIEDDTLIFVLSDNGGPTNKYAVNGSINTPLRGSKGDTWEGGIRVPMLLQWTRRLPTAIYDQPVIQLDIAATSLAAAGVTSRPDGKLDGVNLIPFLTGREKRAPHRDLYWRFGGHMAIRRGDWKVVRTWDNTEPELYNLRQDIGETRNLARQEPARFKELMAAWSMWNSTLVPPAWPRPEVEPPSQPVRN
jgi:arylsulfatase A-like enzyme